MLQQGNLGKAKLQKLLRFKLTGIHKNEVGSLEEVHPKEQVHPEDVEERLKKKTLPEEEEEEEVPLKKETLPEEEL